jgi:predicted DNA-binding protein
MALSIRSKSGWRSSKLKYISDLFDYSTRAAALRRVRQGWQGQRCSGFQAL